MNTQRETRLDALRGLAALVVALGHCTTAFAQKNLYSATITEIDYTNAVDIIIKMMHIIFNADSMVIIFFVLSGYVLNLSLKKIECNYVYEFFKFTIKRMYRIFPTLIVSLLPLTIFVTTDGVNLVKNMLLINSNINGVTWTLKIEVIAGLIIFVTCIFKNAKIKWMLVPYVAFFVFKFFDTNILTYKYIPAFFLGMLAQEVKSKKVSLKKNVIVAILSVTILCLSNFILGYKTNISLITQMISGAAIVFCIDSNAFKTLDNKFLLFMGKISYAFYVMHYTGQIIFIRLCEYIKIPLGSMSRLANIIVYSIGSIAVTIVLSLIVYLIIEKPCSKPDIEFLESLKISKKGVRVNSKN